MNPQETPTSHLTGRCAVSIVGTWIEYVTTELSCVVKTRLTKGFKGIKLELEQLERLRSEIPPPPHDYPY